MKLYVVDSFTTLPFSGNQAGVAWLGEKPFPSETLMRHIAAELKHSETVFCRALGDKGFHLRYFTPEGEVDLCGHATIGAFVALIYGNIIQQGTFTIKTLAGTLPIQVGEDGIWMDMAPPVLGRGFSQGETAQLYAAYGLTLADCPKGYRPQCVSTGLMDILLPVASKELLYRGVQNQGEVTRLSLLYDVVGVHLYYPQLSEGIACHCRNFAPRYGIPEESATGTATGSLTYALYEEGRIQPDTVHTFYQGETMGRPSTLLSRITQTPEGEKVSIGGQGVVTLELTLGEGILPT